VHREPVCFGVFIKNYSASIIVNHEKNTGSPELGTKAIIAEIYGKDFWLCE